MDTSKIGTMLLFHRRQAKLSQAELGKLAGVGKTVIFDLEKGKLSVRFDTLLKVLKVLNIRIDLYSPLMDVFKEQSDEKG